ncbi:MAG: LytTR family transcriptional regulator, partial [Methylocystaceae bacterium]
VGVDPARDELAFYPMLYWPIVATAPLPSAQAIAKTGVYLKQGGTIVFDTRDALTAHGDGPPSAETRWLRELTRNLDIPELEVVPRDHVITKTFYLLDGFYGRTTNGKTWVEALPPEQKDDPARPVRATDSVSSIVITSNDLAAAWAVDRNGQPLHTLTPGGARQRELAIRGGVNLVMYTLTGNYKSDQVHVRDLLERLGQ